MRYNKEDTISMNNEKHNLIKSICIRLTHIGIIICFVLITYFVVGGQLQESEPSSTNEIHELTKEHFEPRKTTAAIQNNLTPKMSTIEYLENNSVFKPSSILQLPDSLTLAENTSEQLLDEQTKDTSTFALLQNSPALGKSAIEETTDELTESDQQEEQTEGETESVNPITKDNESSTEDTTPEQTEENTIVEDSPGTPIENDPALDVTVITQKPQHTFPYSEKLPLPYEHQEYLYNLCLQYGLEYEKVLAVMEHESKFNPNAIGATSDFGYFQINSINHQWLSEKLGTANAPLDPYVNMQWGTFFLDDLYDYWENQGLTGDALDEAVLSSYNKGKTGYRRTGKATNYIAKVKESYALIQNEYIN